MDFSKFSADLESQPIQGWLPDGRHINIPLISHITENLYVGGYLPGVDLGNFFSHIFSLYQWERYTHADSTEYVAVEMYDTDRSPVDVESVEEISNRAITALGDGGNVLIKCQAGINRSNLVTARVLMKGLDMSAREAIALLRVKRSPLVLANNVFENWLLSLDFD